MDEDIYRMEQEGRFYLGFFIFLIIMALIFGVSMAYISCTKNNSKDTTAPTEQPVQTEQPDQDPISGD